MLPLTVAIYSKGNNFADTARHIRNTETRYQKPMQLFIYKLSPLLQQTGTITETKRQLIHSILISTRSICKNLTDLVTSQGAGEDDHNM